MQCDALITVKLTLGYGKCQFPLATWRLRPDFSPQTRAVSGLQLMGTALPEESHSASNLPLPPPLIPWGTITFFITIPSSTEITSRVLSSSPKYISQANSFRSVVLLFFSFFDPPWVASPGFSTQQEREKGIWNQLVPMLRLLVHNQLFHSSLKPGVQCHAVSPVSLPSINYFRHKQASSVLEVQTLGSLRTFHSKKQAVWLPYRMFCYPSSKGYGGGQLYGRNTMGP